MNKSLVLLASLLLLSGCQSPQTNPAPSEQVAKVEPKAQKYASFSEETLNSLLVAELAWQRNRLDITLNNYLEQARSTRDPAVAERAFRVAEYMGAGQEALDTALIWANVAPDNLEAQRVAAVQLARTGQYDESMLYMERVLSGHGDTHFDFLALSVVESDAESRAALLQSFERLQKRYPENSQLLFGRALLMEQEGRTEEALELLEDHSASEHEVPPLLLRAHLLQKTQRNKDALPLLRNASREHPEDKRVQLAYARVLAAVDRLEDAQAELSALLVKFPEDNDLRLSLAQMYMEGKAWDEAKAHLQDLLKRDSYIDSAHYNLGLIAEEQKDPKTALKEYALVRAGNDYLPAQLHQAEILLDQNRGSEASRRLAQAREDQPDYAIQLYLIECDLLSQHEQTDRAWQMIQQALQHFPDESNLLYARAALAEKRSDLVQMEKDLRLIIQREPDNADALNALGYALADRTKRYAEAKVLIQKAHELSPESPAILDSLGWVHFRLGNLTEAESYLRKALEGLPDPEVAAHLGEVLWVQGRQREARKVWRTALEADPESGILRKTITRLTGSGEL